MSENKCPIWDTLVVEWNEAAKPPYTAKDVRDWDTYYVAADTEDGAKIKAIAKAMKEENSFSSNADHLEVWARPFCG